MASQSYIEDGNLVLRMDPKTEETLAEAAHYHYDDHEYNLHHHQDEGHLYELAPEHHYAPHDDTYTYDAHATHHEDYSHLFGDELAHHAYGEHHTTPITHHFGDGEWAESYPAYHHATEEHLAVEHPYPSYYPHHDAYSHSDHHIYAEAPHHTESHYSEGAWTSGHESAQSTWEQPVHHVVAEDTHHYEEPVHHFAEHYSHYTPYHDTVAADRHHLYNEAEVSSSNDYQKHYPGHDETVIESHHTYTPAYEESHYARVSPYDHHYYLQ